MNGTNTKQTNEYSPSAENLKSTCGTAFPRLRISTETRIRVWSSSRVTTRTRGSAPPLASFGVVAPLLLLLLLSPPPLPPLRAPGGAVLGGTAMVSSVTLTCCRSNWNFSSTVPFAPARRAPRRSRSMPSEISSTHSVSIGSPSTFLRSPSLATRCLVKRIVVSLILTVALSSRTTTALSNSSWRRAARRPFRPPWRRPPHGFVLPFGERRKLVLVVRPERPERPDRSERATERMERTERPLMELDRERAVNGVPPRLLAPEWLRTRPPLTEPRVLAGKRLRHVPITSEHSCFSRCRPRKLSSSRTTRSSLRSSDRTRSSLVAVSVHAIDDAGSSCTLASSSSTSCARSTMATAPAPAPAPASGKISSAIARSSPCRNECDDDNI